MCSFPLPIAVVEFALRSIPVVCQLIDHYYFLLCPYNFEFLCLFILVCMLQNV